MRIGLEWRKGLHKIRQTMMNIGALTLDRLVPMSCRGTHSQQSEWDAVCRRSGRLLRIDAAGIEAGEGVSEVWAKVPPPQAKRPVSVRVRPTEVGKRGVAAFFGI